MRGDLFETDGEEQPSTLWPAGIAPTKGGHPFLDQPRAILTGTIVVVFCKGRTWFEYHGRDHADARDWWENVKLGTDSAPGGHYGVTVRCRQHNCCVCDDEPVVVLRWCAE